MDENYKKAVSILTEKSQILDNMANLLLREETIYQEEVDEIMAGEEYEVVAKRLDDKLRARKEADDKHQKEQEILRKAKMHELKAQTAEALYKAGVISEKELNAIRVESEAAMKQSEKKLEEIQYAAGEQAADTQSVSEPVIKDANDANNLQVSESKTKSTKPRAKRTTKPKAADKDDTKKNNKKEEK